MREREREVGERRKRLWREGEKGGDTEVEGERERETGLKESERERER